MFMILQHIVDNLPIVW